MTRVCTNCGYGVNVQPVAVLVAGRVAIELRLCGNCRNGLLDRAQSLSGKASATRV